MNAALHAILDNDFRKEFHLRCLVLGGDVIATFNRVSPRMPG